MTNKILVIAFALYKRDTLILDISTKLKKVFLKGYYIVL